MLGTEILFYSYWFINITFCLSPRLTWLESILWRSHQIQISAKYTRFCYFIKYEIWHHQPAQSCDLETKESLSISLPSHPHTSSIHLVLSILPSVNLPYQSPPIHSDLGLYFYHNSLLISFHASLLPKPYL